MEIGVELDYGRLLDPDDWPEDVIKEGEWWEHLIYVKLVHGSDHCNDVFLAREAFEDTSITEEELKPLQKLWVDATTALSLPAVNGGGLPINDKEIMSSKPLHRKLSMTTRLPSFCEGLPVAIRGLGRIVIIEKSRGRIQYRGVRSLFWKDGEFPISDFKAVEFLEEVWDWPDDPWAYYVSVKLVHGSDHRNDVMLAREPLSTEAHITILRSL